MDTLTTTPGNMTMPVTHPCADNDLVCRLKKVIDGGPEAIDERIAQLDREWTAGRAAKATAGLMLVLGFAMVALGFSPWWLLLPAVGGVVLVQYLFGRHTLIGWFFHRAVGLRTGTEIEQEKVALKTLRGDFQHLPTIHHVVHHDDISRLEGEGGIVCEPEEAPVDPDVAVQTVIGAARR